MNEVTITEKQKESSRKAALKYYYANKEKAAEKAKEYRLKNKDHIRTKQREDKRNRKLWAIDFLGGKCMGCQKQFHPAVYEFHHTDPTTKDRDPSKMLSLSIEKLKIEISKCDLLCANCHRMTHHGDNY